MDFRKSEYFLRTLKFWFFYYFDKMELGTVSILIDKLSNNMKWFDKYEICINFSL